MFASIADVREILSVKLTDLVNITGCGLKPLSDYTTIRKLDLSLVSRTESSIECDIEMKLLEAEIIPILYSIIDDSMVKLKHIQFPKKWREERSHMLIRFITEYNQHMNFQFETCGRYRRGCDKGCAMGIAKRPWISKSADTFGTYNFTCYSCANTLMNTYQVKRLTGIDTPLCEVKRGFCSETLECDRCGVSVE